MYGRLWEGEAQYIVPVLKDYLRNNPDGTIRLHTPGGSVIDGNLIFNTIKAHKGDVNMVIDGIAASMGSIIMLAGKTVSIADNGFIMIHAPSGSVSGGAKALQSAAKVLTMMTADFRKRYVAKTGKTEEEVDALLDGSDNWFSADEALELGLVDSIVSAVFEDDLSAVAYSDLSAVASADIFKSYDGEHAPINKKRKTSDNEVTPNKHNMKLNAVSIAFLGLSAQATEMEINAAIEAKSKALESAEQRAADAEQKIKDLTGAQIKATLDTAVKEGQILAADRPEWESIFEANYELGVKTLSKLPKKPVITGSLEQENNNQGVAGITAERKDWTFTDWSRKDTQGLLKLKAEQPEIYKQLASAAGVNL